MAMKGYSTFPKAPRLEPSDCLISYIGNSLGKMNLSQEVKESRPLYIFYLQFCSCFFVDAADVIYNPSRQGYLGDTTCYYVRFSPELISQFPFQTDLFDS